ncbi:MULTISPECIES: EF-hand domain-containing protein [unclassified Luteimonas]
MNNVRKPLTGLLALGFALAMPMAFAQEADDLGQEPTAPTGQPAPQGQVSWNDLDSDGDGNLSRSEAAGLAQLASVFDQADADGDGVLTPQEYQAWAASQGAGAPPPQED